MYMPSNCCFSQIAVEIGIILSRGARGVCLNAFTGSEICNLVYEREIRHVVNLRIGRCIVDFDAMLFEMALSGKSIVRSSASESISTSLGI